MQVRRYLIHSLSKAWVLHSTEGQGVVVFDSLRGLCRSKSINNWLYLQVPSR